MVLLAFMLIGYFYLQNHHTIRVGMTAKQVEAIKKPATVFYKNGHENWTYPSKRVWSANGVKDTMMVSFKNDTVAYVLQ